MAHYRKERIDFQKLIASSEAARATLAEARVELKHKFDIVGRVKEAITSRPAAIIGGSVIGGFLLKKIFFGRAKRIPSGRADRKIKELKTERGFLVGLFALLLTVVKPAAKLYATKLLKDYFEKRNDSGGKGRPGLTKHY